MGGERAHQKISNREREVGQGQRSAEAEAIRQAAAEDGQKPNSESDHTHERSGLLGGEVQGFVKKNRQHSGLRVVGQALKKLGDVGHPKSRFEATPNFSQTILEVQWGLERAGAVRFS